MRKVHILLILFLISCSEKTLYDSTLVDLEGKKVNLASLYGSRTAFYIWTGTCAGHTDDLKAISQLYKKGDVKINLFSIAVFMEPEEVASILKREGIERNFPILADPHGEIAALFQLIYVPATILVDEEGYVFENHPGLSLKLVYLAISPN
jgi:peroxiredoxin